MKPTLYLMCGLPGSGKTTRATELEAACQGILMNADSLVCLLYPEDAEAAATDNRKGLVHHVQWELAQRLLAAGNSVILDWSFSKRTERDECRDRGRDFGVEVRTIFLDPPLETLHDRIALRNQDLPPGTFHISAEELDEWAPLFERPTPEELLLD